MEVWKEILIAVITSIFGGGGAAWIYLKLVIKDTAGTIVDKKLKNIDENIDKKLENYTTREDMQIERKELLVEVERRFLEKVAFEQFTKRFDDKFDVMSKTLDKVVENQEHIKDYIIQQR